MYHYCNKCTQQTATHISNSSYLRTKMGTLKFHDHLCKTRQNITTHWNTDDGDAEIICSYATLPESCSLSRKQPVSLCCSLLRCVAVRFSDSSSCSVLQCFAECCCDSSSPCSVAVCCSDEHCNTIQCTIHSLPKNLPKRGSLPTKRYCNPPN